MWHTQARCIDEQLDEGSALKSEGAQSAPGQQAIRDDGPAAAASPAWPSRTSERNAHMTWSVHKENRAFRERARQAGKKFRCKA
eukprot:2994371-Amphidinium_carterae.1